MKKIYLVAVLVAVVVVGSAAYYYLAMPKPKENLIDAFEVFSAVDPNSDKIGDFVNITVRWGGHENIALHIANVEQPPHTGLNDSEDKVVNYGDVFVLRMSDYNAWFEIRDGEQIIHLFKDGSTLPSSVVEQR